MSRPEAVNALAGGAHGTVQATGPKKTAFKPIRVVIVDDQCLFRQGLRMALDQDARFQVIGEAADGESAVVLVAESTPDVVILDAALPRLSGPQAARMILKRSPTVKVLILSAYDTREDVAAAFEAGASAYVSKGADCREFMRIVCATAAGEPIESPFLLTADHGRPSPLSLLTSRERDIFKHLSRALSNKEIASELGISPETVKSRLQHIYSKLGVRNRTEAARFGAGDSPQPPVL